MQSHFIKLSALAAVVHFLSACGTNLESPEAAIMSASQALDGVTCTNSVGGYYCGGDMVDGGDTSTLYRCSGEYGSAPTSSQVCSAGCNVAPPGQNDFCAGGDDGPASLGTLAVTPDNLSVLESGSFTPPTGAHESRYLLWGSGQALRGAGSFWPSELDADGYQGTTIGDGECTSLVKALTGNTSATWQWRPSVSVMGSSPVSAGTAIATFTNGRYDSGHAAIFAGYASGGDGFYVYDQNWVGGAGSHHVGHHRIGTSGSGVASAYSYLVITAP